jgi:hypothetical protein
LSVSTWSPRKLDKRATREAKERANASEKAGVRLYKTVLASDALDRIEAIESTARVEHQKRTVPWQYSGPGAITAAGYPAYKGRMFELKTQFDKAVTEFYAEYESERASVLSNASHPLRLALGKLFDPVDYPDVSQLTGKFNFSVTAEPMPRANDFRIVGLANDDVMAIKQEIEVQHDNAVAAAGDTALARVVAHVEKLKLRLDGYTPKGNGHDKVEGKFHDTVVTNIVELVELLPSINIAGKLDTARMGQKLMALTAYTGEDLRASEALRKEISKAASALLVEIRAA